MEFDEHDDDPEEEMEEGMPVTPGYDTAAAANSSSSGRPTKMGSGELLEPYVVQPQKTTKNSRKSGGGVRYRECLKNHAVGIGGHAVDGCGEFMAAGEEGTLDALKCAACNCHRNFHRKETPGETGNANTHHNNNNNNIQLGGGIYHPPPPQHLHPPQFSTYYPPAAPPLPPSAPYPHITQQRPLALPAASGGGYSREEDVSNPSSSGGGGGGSGGGGVCGGSSKKRFRTRFSQEQKDKMLAFAERLGWRIQKHDDASVEAFCSEMGVKRHVLKVWMHNNKHTLGKKP